jgi:ABC-type molybdate transport system permease subunit
MANPGINDRKIKTMISLRIGVFSKIAIFAKKVMIGIRLSTLLSSVSTPFQSFLTNCTMIPFVQVPTQGVGRDKAET